MLQQLTQTLVLDQSAVASVWTFPSACVLPTRGGACSARVPCPQPNPRERVTMFACSTSSSSIRLSRGGNHSCTRLPHAAVTVSVSRPSRRTVQAKANDGDRKRVDWDREWSSYVNNKQQQDTGGSRRSNVYTTTGSSQRRQSVPVDPTAKVTRDAIKREESFLLNAWTSDKFQGAGVALAVLVLLVLLLAAGPPPADSRCTLPWC